MTINANHIAALLVVAHAAIEHSRAANVTKHARDAYYAACRQWKEDNGFDRYEKIFEADGGLADKMFEAVFAERDRLVAAKRAEYNAKRRLHTAIRKAGVA